jgi:hypothetical protein
VSAYIRTKEKAAAKKHAKKMADKVAKKAAGGGASDEEGSDGGGSDGGEAPETAPAAGDAPDTAPEGAVLVTALGNEGAVSVKRVERRDAQHGASTSENDSPQSAGAADDEARAAANAQPGANAQHGAEGSTCLSLASFAAPYWASVDGTPLVRSGFNLKSATVGRLEPGTRVQVRATFQLTSDDDL